MSELDAKLRFAVWRQEMRQILARCSFLEVVELVDNQSIFTNIDAFIPRYTKLREHRVPQPFSEICFLSPEKQRSQWLMDCVAKLEISGECYINLFSFWTHIRVVNSENWLAELWSAAGKAIKDIFILPVSQKYVLSVISDRHDDKIEAFMEPVEEIFKQAASQSRVKLSL